MPDQAEQMIVQNIIAALDRLQEDSERVELWTAALDCFRCSIPDYQPGDQYLLPTARQSRSRDAAV